jgi:large subunit ribosomal protein L15
MQLTQVHEGIKKNRRKKKVGRGVGSGHGKTATKGSKGQWSRAGNKMPSQLYEGGQMPLIRRMPKRGFNNNTWRKEAAVFNVDTLSAKFADGETVSLQTLRDKGMVRHSAQVLRILGNGELTKKLTVEADYISPSAQQKIQAANGKITTPGEPKP